MPKYNVSLSQVYKQNVTIEADSVKDAIALALDGEGDEYGDAHYSYTIEEVDESDVSEDKD